MHHLILWCGFLGAWLLVLGPLYQATIELTEEDEELNRLRRKMEDAPKPEPVSRWWWLLPPVAWYLRNQRAQAIRAAVISDLDDDEFLTMFNFGSKARGWLYVGLGGLLIAVKESWELVEGNEWPVLWFWVLVVVGIAVSIGNSFVSGHLAAKVRAEHGHGRHGRSTSPPA